MEVSFQISEGLLRESLTYREFPETRRFWHAFWICVTVILALPTVILLALGLELGAFIGLALGASLCGIYIGTSFRRRFREREEIISMISAHEATVRLDDCLEHVTSRGWTIWNTSLISGFFENDHLLIINLDGVGRLAIPKTAFNSSHDAETFAREIRRCSGGAGDALSEFAASATQTLKECFPLEKGPEGKTLETIRYPNPDIELKHNSTIGVAMSVVTVAVLLLLAVDDQSVWRPVFGTLAFLTFMFGEVICVSLFVKRKSRRRVKRQHFSVTLTDLGVHRLEGASEHFSNWQSFLKAEARDKNIRLTMRHGNLTITVPKSTFDTLQDFDRFVHTASACIQVAEVDVAG